MKIICIQSPIYDYLTSTLIEGLQLLGHTIMSTENSNYQKKSNDTLLKKNAENADLLIFFSNKLVRYNLLSGVDNPNKIFVDGDDSQKFLIPNFIKFKAIFKRELNRYYINKFNENIFPLPFAAEKRYFFHQKVHRDISISYVANMHSAYRYAVYECLTSKNIKSSYLGTTTEPRGNSNIKGGPKETPIFRNILYRSNISVNVIGGGYDCARYWEILSSGALLLTQNLDILIPNPFMGDINCVTFNSLKELDEKVDFLLDNKDLVSSLAHNGYKHLINFHTTKARAEYFLDCLNNIKEDSFCNSFYNPEKKKFSFYKFFR